MKWKRTRSRRFISRSRKERTSPLPGPPAPASRRCCPSSACSTLRPTPTISPPVGDPLSLMADEPTGNWASKNGEAVMELLPDLHRNGATICMVTHDQRYANFAERTIPLFDGRIVEETQEARVGAD